MSALKWHGSVAFPHLHTAAVQGDGIALELAVRDGCECCADGKSVRWSVEVITLNPHREFVTPDEAKRALERVTRALYAALRNHYVTDCAK